MTFLMQLFYGTNDYITEGITNKEGLFVYESKIKENFITITAGKPGYYPAQRTYVTLSEHKGDNETDDITEEINIVMVKESTIVNDECFIMINYCNLLSENFEQDFLFSDKSKTLLI
jgi:hypothetical protein